MLIGNLEGDELIMQTVTSISKRDYIIKFKSGAILKNNRRSDKRGIIAKMTRLGKILNVDYYLELETIYGDIGLAIFLVEKQLNKLYKLTGCSRIDIWFGPTNGSNFRFNSAKTVPYKSNRPPKPAIVTELRNFLITFKGAQVIDGYEADDALGIYQKLEKTVAIHCDKDIYMIPGLHYDTINDKFIEVDELGFLELIKGKLKGTGLKLFYAQLLMGDRTDTIPPLKRGLGPVKVYNYLKDCMDERDLLNEIISIYGDVFQPFTDRLLEQADLIWICRNKNEKGSDYIKRKYLEFFGEVL